MDEKLWTHLEVAEYLNKTPTAIRIMCSKRQIPFVKIGRAVRFRPSDLERFVNDRAVDVT